MVEGGDAGQVGPRVAVHQRAEIFGRTGQTAREVDRPMGAAAAAGAQLVLAAVDGPERRRFRIRRTR